MFLLHPPLPHTHMP
ncbi:hypothetical protein E2C01_060023 [Portunus trituberculatus]|uniref:Uncharacterized protein n=1 Tax=Portunus trituberculatus TaxID=210409 RepID=A0A5B7H870_PORTR|nr:hypothetical protein [Portunus trituberculatus]